MGCPPPPPFFLLPYLQDGGFTEAGQESLGIAKGCSVFSLAFHDDFCITYAIVTEQCGVPPPEVQQTLAVIGAGLHAGVYVCEVLETEDGCWRLWVRL